MGSVQLFDNGSWRTASSMTPGNNFRGKWGLTTFLYKQNCGSASKFFQRTDPGMVNITIRYQGPTNQLQGPLELKRFTQEVA
jgi:hypothetical protein